MIPLVQNNEIVIAPNRFETPGMSDEVLEVIFSSLNSAQDAVSLGLANKQLQQIFLGNHVWKPFLMRHFPHSFAQNQMKIEGLDLYKQFTCIQNNIQNDICTKKTLKFDFSEGVNYYGACQVHGNRLFHFSGGDADFISVFDLTTQKEIGSLKFTDLVGCIYVQGDRLYAAGIYARDTIPCIMENGQVKQFGEYDACILFHSWDLKNLEPLETFYTDYALEHDDDGIDCLYVQGNELFGGVGEQVIIWDLKTETLKTKIPCDGQVLSLRAQGDVLYVQTYANPRGHGIEKWNLKDIELGNNNKSFTPFEGTVSFEIFENYVVVLKPKDRDVGVNLCIYDTEIKLVAGLSFEAFEAKLFRMHEGRFYIQSFNKVHILNFTPSKVKASLFL